MKSDLRRLIKAHYASYVDVNTGRVRWQDHVVFTGLPLLALATCIWRGLELSTEAAAALLTVSGLLGAFLFGVMLQISQRAMGWADDAPVPGPATSKQAAFLREIAANAGYAALAAILAAMLFVIATVTTELVNTIVSIGGLVVGLHLILVLLMVIVRIFDLTDGSLRDTRTGANVHRLPRKRAG